MYTNNKLSEIETTIKNYFEGIFYGDVAKLRSSFDNNARLYGDIKGVPYQKTLDEYLEGVENRKSPRDQGEDFAMKVLGVEVLGNAATVKLHVPMLGYNYYDHLALSLIDKEWKIVNKLFTHVE